MNLPNIPLDARPETELQLGNQFFGELVNSLGAARARLPQTHKLEVHCLGFLAKRIVMMNGGMLAIEGVDESGCFGSVLTHWRNCAVVLRVVKKEEDPEPRPELGFHTLFAGGPKHQAADL